MLIAARNAMMAGKKPYLKRLQYIESIGSQYVDTGYIPNINTECAITFIFKGLDSTYRTPFSVRRYDGAPNSFSMAASITNSLNFAYGHSYWETPLRPQTNTRYTATLKSGNATINNLWGNAGTSITPTTLTAYMFARNANGTASNFFKGYVYDCFIKENGAFICSYIPVLDLNGEPKMFDLVSQTYPAHYGTFIAGPELIGGGV